MEIISKGQSLKELKEEYGVGANGFYDSHWYKDEAFFTDKPEAGVYEVNIEEKAFIGMRYDEQVKKLKNGWGVSHPAILMQALLEYHAMTGKYAMEDWGSWTSLLASDGCRVRVGRCDADGVGVGGGLWDGGSRLGDVGLSASRKLETGIDAGTLELSYLSSLELRIKKTGGTNG